MFISTFIDNHGLAEVDVAVQRPYGVFGDIYLFVASMVLIRSLMIAGMGTFSDF